MDCGVAINPATPTKPLWAALDDCDLVLVMSVNPGWGGQGFIDSSLCKIEDIANEISKRNLKTIIQVDGGVKDDTAARCRDAGAHVLVAGAYIFGADDRQAAVASLR